MPADRVSSKGLLIAIVTTGFVEQQLVWVAIRAWYVCSNLFCTVPWCYIYDELISMHNMYSLCCFEKLCRDFKVDMRVRPSFALIVDC